MALCGTMVRLLCMVLPDNEDNVADLISLGGVQKLMDASTIFCCNYGRVYIPAEMLGHVGAKHSSNAGVGKRFYAHRIGLISSSDALRAMFDGGYKERDTNDVQIPNIRWETFELMMRFIYTGSVEVNMGIAQDLLKGADQYLLDRLKRKRLCMLVLSSGFCRR
uniref:BTB domain-containing protein n=1 Tax=Tanacetum cinerariifolium TaxID=118510 RepID=A0A6L2NPI2_TANCI|nr:hypothetical protein [Tanacetum cinerariifolium]